MHARAPADGIFDDPITNLLSTLSSFIEILSCTRVKRKKISNVFKFGTLIGHFLPDGAASVAVKGLKGIHR